MSKQSEAFWTLRKPHRQWCCLIVTPLSALAGSNLSKVKSWMIFLSPSFFGMINTLFLLWSLYVMRQIILLWRYCFRLIGILKWFYISLIFSFVATVSHTQFVILEGFRFVDWENLGGLAKGSKQKLMMMGALDNFCYPFQAFYRWNEFLS